MPKKLLVSTASARRASSCNLRHCSKVAISFAWVAGRLSAWPIRSHHLGPNIGSCESLRWFLWSFCCIAFQHAEQASSIKIYHIFFWMKMWSKLFPLWFVLWKWRQTLSELPCSCGRSGLRGPSSHAAWNQRPTSGCDCDKQRQLWPCDSRCFRRPWKPTKRWVFPSRISCTHQSRCPSDKPSNNWFMTATAGICRILLGTLAWFCGQSFKLRLLQD